MITQVRVSPTRTPPRPRLLDDLGLVGFEMKTPLKFDIASPKWWLRIGENTRYVKVRNYNDWANSSPGLQSFTLVTLFCHVAVVFCLLWCDDLQSHVMIPTSDC